MAIEKNTFKVARFGQVYHSLLSINAYMSSENEDFQRRNSISAVESDDDDDDDCDSGAGSDDFDLLESGETGEELCQVGDQTCSIPYELYDLPGLKDVLSMEVWNEFLTEGERFGLARYLPDMDQEDFMFTLNELFSGDDLHFGSPLDKLFEMLKGGLCEPRVALYRQGLNFFQRSQHYHFLQRHQNTLVNNLFQIRDAWLSYRGYSVEEKLRVLNITKSQKSLMNENMEATIYQVAVHRFPQVVANSKTGVSKIWNKHQCMRDDRDIDSFRGIPISERNDSHSLGWRKSINQLSDIKVLTAKPSNARYIYDGGERVKHAENLQQFSAENQMRLVKAQNSNLIFKGSQVELSDEIDSAWLSRQYGGLFPSDLSSNPSILNAKNKRLKMRKEAVELPENDKLFHAEYRAKSLKDKFQASSLQNGRRGVVKNQRMRVSPESEETESGSSEQMDEDDNPLNLMRSKWAFSGNVPDLKYGRRTKNAKLFVRDKKDSHLTINGSSKSSLMIEGSNKDPEMMKGERKGKMNDIGYLNIFPNKGSDKNYFPGPGSMMGSCDQQEPYQLGWNDNVEENHGGSFPIPSMKMVKDEVCHGIGSPLFNYKHGYQFLDDCFWMRQVKVDNGFPVKLVKKGQMVELPAAHHPQDIPLMECNYFPGKWKMKHDLTYMDLQDYSDSLHADAQLQLNDRSSLKKRGKNKLEDVPDSLEKGMPEPPIVEMEIEDVEAEHKPHKNPFPLITPTVLSGFSFSIIHLLSAVRMAMISLLPDDSSEAKKHIVKDDDTSWPSAQAIVPSLTVQEIVSRVRSNPGDPCILETQEPLQDLVRGVLKILSSRTAPLGAKGWKTLVVYERSSKCWTWIGPVSVSHNMSDSEAVEEVTSPDSWGLPNKMLVKLVDSYANWLKNSQDALQQLGSLPSPPLMLMQANLDERERFKEMRAQKSPITISPSSEEVKDYFRKEEFLRYLIPDRAFSYTAVDGKKSIVAPLRWGSGKPTSKARDHFMLKRERPPHVTILCLVRDAAARLPGSIGTRADVCTLIRDSQYIVENVSDAKVNQVVSGALDRLHYERDPCVQFDGERKLWVYLHREREEEDFEDEGTSSTKKWRRQKKEATESSDQGEITVYRGHVGQSESDLVSDPNVEASCIDNDKRVEENAEISHGFDQGLHDGPVWNSLGLNTMEENS